MNTPAQVLHRSLALAGLATAFVLCPLALRAQTWDGGGSTISWGTAANWEFDTLPSFNTTTDLIFNTTTKPDINIGAARIIRSITFGADIDSNFVVNFRSFAGGASALMTMQAASGNATLTVDAGATGNISYGWVGTSTAGGSLSLGSNLDIVHNGSGTLTFSRQIVGTGGFTKSGSGTMQVAQFNTNSFTGAANFDGGRAIFGNTNTAGGDLNTASAVNLDGGTLEIRTTNALAKTLTPNTTVSSASTLAYNNTTAATQTFAMTTGSLALNADLTVQNISADTTLVNGINITRNITGSGDLIVDTYNNIASSAASYSLGRVFITGDNSGWNGDLVISRGTVSLGGPTATTNSAGTGTIVLGTTADAFGAGLTFFHQQPAVPNASNITYANNIIVRSGGFRSIKSSGADHRYIMSGNVALEGNLNVDHTVFGDGRNVTLSGNITGSGGIDITRAGGASTTFVRLDGTNDYTGATTVATGAGLIVDGSLTSNVSVASGARFGGNGSTTGDLSFASGALFVFSPTASFNVGGTVTLDSSFSIASLVNANGSVIDWSGVQSGNYTLISAAGTFAQINNFGLANAFDLGDGRNAYFQDGSLELVVAAIPEPSAVALIGGLAALVLSAVRRRRRSAA